MLIDLLAHGHREIERFEPGLIPVLSQISKCFGEGPLAFSQFSLPLRQVFEQTDEIRSSFLQTPDVGRVLKNALVFNLNFCLSFCLCNPSFRVLVLAPRVSDALL